MTEITLVKAAGPGDRDHASLTGGDVARRGPIHVLHDLPHLVVESLSGITDGLWGELASGFHAAAGHAASARDPKHQKQGRIVSGAAAGACGTWERRWLAVPPVGKLKLVWPLARDFFAGATGGPAAGQ